MFKNKMQVKDVTFCTRIDLAVWLELYSSSDPQRYRANLASDFNSAIFLSNSIVLLQCWTKKWPSNFSDKSLFISCKRCSVYSVNKHRYKKWRFIRISLFH